MGRDFLTRSRLPPHLDLVLLFFSSKKSFCVFLLRSKTRVSLVLGASCCFLLLAGLDRKESFRLSYSFTEKLSFSLWIVFDITFQSFLVSLS